MILSRRQRLALGVLLGAGCSDEGAEILQPSPSGGGAGQPDTVVGGACQVVVQEAPPESAQHLTNCTPVTYATNPPSGGDHYGNWANFGIYDFPLPAGFLVHSLEHGAVVLWYNCPEGCADEVGRAETMIGALPVDPQCSSPGVERRVILVPYPQLETRWAASSWGWTLQADCFDPDAFAAFATAHYAQGREDLCAPGQAFAVDPCE